MEIRLRGKNPIQLNIAVKEIRDSDIFEIKRDGGNKLNRSGSEYHRYLDVSVKRKRTDQVDERPDPEQLATMVWTKIMRETDTDQEAIDILIRLIKVERKITTIQKR